ncbi:hypothetical protein AB7W88_06485, partial [Providencia vermicola]|uniref:hypothetical protein n=1 Tax=Providencia vermicola TaxID=333965 RepID=UPI0034E37A48
VQTTFGGVCGAKKGGLALHFGLESALFNNDLINRPFLLTPIVDISNNKNSFIKDEYMMKRQNHLFISKTDCRHLFANINHPSPFLPYKSV